MESKRSESRSVVTARDVVSSDLGRATVLLHLKSGVYYTLDAVGSMIWSLIQKPKTVAEVHADLLATYEIDTEQCRQDLVAFLEDLAAQGLIEYTHAPTP